jgi:UMF1 family MFS transporter
MDQVSARGFALGYLGGGILLAINLLWITKPQWFLIGDAETASRVSFLSVAVWWAAFSVPILRVVPEPAGTHAKRSAGIGLGSTVRELARTFQQIRRYGEAAKFLVAFWAYSDGIGTIIRMAVIYGADVGIGESDLIGALLLTQFIGFPCTILFGGLARRWRPKTCICATLMVYTGICVGGFLMSRAWHFWALAAVVGLVQGGSQALSRSLFASMIPKAKSAQFFAFYNISGKFAGIFGPLVFAVVGQLVGSSRLGILSLIAFFVLGASILFQVDHEKGIAEANRGTV